MSAEIIFDTSGNCVITSDATFCKRPSFFAAQVGSTGSSIITFPALGVDIKFPPFQAIYSNLTSTSSSSHFIYNGSASIMGYVGIDGLVSRGSGDTGNYILRYSLFKNGTFYKSYTTANSSSPRLGTQYNWIPLDPGDTLDLYVAITGGSPAVTFPKNMTIFNVTNINTFSNKLSDTNIFAIKMEMA